ncbi:MAG: helix-turn-helix domain-containing protein [Candidatus Paceibacterota bacterium]|nr:MAG: helix-turn-helix domain-containing protein [Candidatus Paceibacterota bacterium]
MKLKERHKAVQLRGKGFSLKEISDNLNVSKSSVSLWVRDVELSDEAKELLRKKYTRGQIASQEVLRAKKRARLDESKQKALDILKVVDLDKESKKVICAVIYWCEGVKNDSYFGFINSDPNLISTFLKLLRASFVLNEKKFRVCIHLHNYHSEKTQKAFWSRITKIPQGQFMKSYKKNNGGKRVRKNYQGCANIRYYDARLAQDLLAIAREYMKGSIG